MRKIWKIFWFEYRLRVWTWRFLLGLVSGPLLIGFFMLFGAGRLSFLSTEEANAMGVVDQSGVIARAENALQRPLIYSPLFSFADETSARQALDEGRILGYYVFADSFVQDGESRLVLKAQGGVVSSQQMTEAMKTALLVEAGYASQTVERMMAGAEMEYHPLGAVEEPFSGESEVPANAQLGLKVLGVFGAYMLQFVFFFALNLVNSYVVRILLEERENRTLEVLMTSVDARHFLAGKVLANVLVGLTQVVAWVLLAAGAVVIFTGSTRLFSFVGGLQIGLVVLYYLLGILLIAGLNSVLTSLVPKPQLASMLTGIVTLPTMIPFLVTSAVAEQPDSVMAVVLGMIPITAIQAVPMRLFFSLPPWWELLISLALLAAAAYGALLLAAWAFQRSVRAGGAGWVRIKPFWRRKARGGGHAQ